MAETYGGIVGAFRFAYRESGSWLFRIYAVLAALVGVFVAITLLLGTITWIADPTGLVGEKALLGVLGIAVLTPLFAPVLLTARRYRLGGATRVSDRSLALSGYLFLASVYLALLITDPNDHEVGGIFAPVIDVIDGLPRLWGLVPPVIAAGIMLVVIRLTGGESSEDGR